MDDKYLVARLDAIDAANMAILKRQTALLGMIAAVGIEESEISEKAMNDFAKAADEFVDRLKEINKECENG